MGTTVPFLLLYSRSVIFAGHLWQKTHESTQIKETVSFLLTVSRVFSHPNLFFGFILEIRGFIRCRTVKWNTLDVNRNLKACQLEQKLTAEIQIITQSFTSKVEVCVRANRNRGSLQLFEYWDRCFCLTPCMFYVMYLCSKSPDSAQKLKTAITITQSSSYDYIA